MELVVLFALFLLAATTGYANPVVRPLDSVCPNGYSQPANSGWDTCYKVFPNFKSRSDAAAQCKSNNGKLASVPNAFVNSYLNLLATQTNVNSFWLGIQCLNGNKTTCKNDDGTPFVYSNFRQGEPSNNGDCVYTSATGRDNQKWISFDCQQEFKFACEVNAVAPTTTPLQTTAGPTLPPPTKCPGQNFYYGDLAILLEQTYDAWGSQMEYAMHNFINFYMLTYANNPYRIDGSTTRILLVPYGNTDQFLVSKSYASGPSSMEQIANRLDGFDQYTNNKKGGIANMNDGLLWVMNAQDHGNRVGSIIIMGSTAKYVNASISTSKSLQRMGYNVFVINFNAINDLSPLASRQEFVYQREEETDNNAIAVSIGAQILNTTPCDPDPQHTGSPPPTYQGPTYIGNVAVVYEQNMATLSSSNTQNFFNFITYRLFFYPGNPYNLARDNTQIILIPYGWTEYYTTAEYYRDGPKSMEEIADELEGSVFTTELWNIESANITDGLSFVLNDAKSLDGVFPRSVILIGYSSDFITAAASTAQKLKDQNYQVFTVSFNPAAEFSMLSSEPKNAFLRLTEANEINIARSIGNILNAAPSSSRQTNN